MNQSPNKISTITECKKAVEEIQLEVGKLRKCCSSVNKDFEVSIMYIEDRLEEVLYFLD